VLVQDLEYAKIRHRLLAQKQVLDLPEPSTEPNDIADDSSIKPKSLGGILLDDADATLTGHWAGSKNFKPYVGSGYIHDGARADGKSIATFNFTAPEAGRYEIRMAYSAHSTRAKKVPIEIKSGAHKVSLTVDQTMTMPPGKSFRAIGSVQLLADKESVLTVTNQGTDGFVILDAIQLVPLAE
ncbi:MAG: delta endotoxin C-terminal domain-containing protein, partial [Verrucomicrobiota bacterium]|nr:delta endotoxin C-terminal domain-containing protein [Verrucomicrobiota bacterium]